MRSNYTSSTPGTRDLMNSQMVSKAMRGVADQMLAQIQIEGKSTYESRARTVQGGRSASNRAGAEVVETDRNWSDVKRRRLVNMSRQFTMRGGG